MSTALAAGQFLAGLLLVFFAPGYFVTRAVFPEWRLIGGDRLRRLLEIFTLSFVLSVALTVLLGELLLVGASGGFQASWTEPHLEIGLAVICLLGFAVGLVRGAYGRTPVAGRAPAAPDEEGAWETSRSLDRVAAEERRLQRRLRELPSDSDAADAARRRLAQLANERETIGREREDAYAQ